MISPPFFISDFVEDGLMNVNEIRDRIMELSHQSGGDEEMRNKALGWLNAAYHELMDEVVAYLPSSLQRVEEVAASAEGKAVLSTLPYRVLKVVNRDAGTSLEMVGKSVVLEVDPSGTATGLPLRCVWNGAEVQVHPATAARLAVLFVPAVADLQAGGEEDSLLLPRAHHSALVWGGMVWSSLFERGFSSQGELLIYQRNWAEAKERVKLSLLVTGNSVPRVTPYELV